MDHNIPFSALDFVTEVRAIQQSYGKPLNGPMHLDPKQQDCIGFMTEDVVTTMAHPILKRVYLELLSLRFFEMCRRRKITMQDEYCKPVIQQLATDLTANYEALPLPLEKLIQVTLYHGCIIPSLIKEFPIFQDTPGIIKRAITNFYFNPQAYLNKVQDNVNELKNDEKFKDWPHWILMQASVNCSSTSRAYLERVEANLESLRDNQSFKKIAAKNSWMLTRAAVGYSDPNAFLERILVTIQEMGKEFSFIKPRVLRRAAVHRPSNSRSLVVQLLKTHSRE